MRLKMSDQVSSSATRMPMSRARRCFCVGRQGGHDVEAGEARKGVRDAQSLGRRERVGGAAPEPERVRSGGLGCNGQDVPAVLHQALVALVRPVPFEQGELRGMEGAALAVAEHARDVEDSRLARRQQLLAGEFGRGVEMEAHPRSVGSDEVGREGVEVRLVAGRDLEDCGLHLEKALRLEMAPQRGFDAPARQQPGAPVGVDIGAPPE
jgi:hypothetical protein